MAMASPIAENLCHTKVMLKKCNYLWIIDDYKSIHYKRAVWLYSSNFSADGDEFMWRLHLNPCATDYYDNTSLTVHLYPDPSSDLTRHGPISGTVKCCILNDENGETKSQSAEFNISKNSGIQYVGFENFVESTYLFSESNRVLPQDKLTIFCELSYIKKTDIVNIEGRPFPNLQDKREPASLEGIGTLFLNPEFSDVTVRVKGKKFTAHKNILAARSPVFKAMLTSEMKEKQTNRIDIEDMTEQVFTEMLRYIYTGQPRDLKTLSAELLSAADRYDLQNLKAMCEKELYENLSPETSVNTLILAYLHHAANLKTQAIQYIKIHSYNTNILSDEVRKVLVESHPHLLLEILDAFGKQSTR